MSVGDRFIVAGWVGACFLLLAYGFVSFGYLSSSSPVAAVLNVIGAAGILASAFHKGNYPTVFLQAVWIFIGLGTLSRVMF